MVLVVVIMMMVVLVVMMPLMVMLLVMMMMVVEAPLTGARASVWILSQIICNRLVARIALQPRYSVNFSPCPLG